MSEHLINQKLSCEDKGTLINIIDKYEEQINSLKYKISSLEEESIRNSTIISGTEAGTWDWNLINDTIIVNNRYLEILGYSPNEYKLNNSKDCFNLIHKEDKPKVEYEIQLHLLGVKKSLECEFRMRNKSGNWVWILTKGRVYKRDERGKPEMIAGMHIDITFSKQLKEKYEANLELWHSAFDFHTSVMLLIDPLSGKIIDANYSAGKFYGYSIDELKKMNISEINDLSPEQINAERLSAFNSERTYFIFPHKLSTGEIRTVEVNSSKVFINNQELLFSIIHDITDRKLAEENLRLSEEKYRTILKTALDGFLILDINGNIIEANESYSELSGYSIDELREMHIINLSAVYNLESLNAKISEIKNGRSLRYETKHKRKDGTIYDVEVSVKYQNIIDGGIFIIFIHNISERKSVANKFKAMRENYERLLNSIDEFIFVFSEKGEILFVNSEVTNHLNYKDDDLVTKNIKDIYGIGIEELTNVGLSKIDEKILPKYIFNKSGEKISVESRIIKGIWNENSAYFGLSKDISQILKSEEKFEKVFNNNPVACAISETKTGNYVDINNAFCELFEYTFEEVIGKNAIELRILNDRIKNEILKNSDLKGGLKNYETILFTKTGKQKHIILTIDTIHVFDKIFRFSVAADITDLKEAHINLTKINEDLNESKNLVEQILIEKETVINQLNETKANLEKINIEKDKLFSVIAHDLRSPFQGFLGLTELLANDLEAIPADEMKDLLLRFNISTKRIYNLLSNLLEWSRMQRGLISFEPQNLDISKIVDQIIMFYIDNKKDIKIINKIPVNSFVFCDEKMINSVIRNLLSNAIKFSNNNSSIIVDISLLDNEFSKISVKDEGIGIPDLLLKNLFVIGEKVGRKGTLGEESTGLGLLLCKEFIEKNNGKIWVESKLNEGSIFYFTLPNKTSFEL